MAQEAPDVKPLISPTVGVDFCATPKIAMIGMPLCGSGRGIKARVNCVTRALEALRPVGEGAAVDLEAAVRIREAS